MKSILLFASLLLSLCALPSAAQVASQRTASDDEALLRKWVSTLGSDDFGGRLPMTEYEPKTINYLADQNLTYMKIKNLGLLSLATGLSLSGANAAAAAEPASDAPKNAGPKKNVLLLIVDDMRPELNCYGHADMVTPNMDALAAQGTLFTRAYCNIAVSGATRASLLTGTRPTRNTFQSAHLYSQEQKPDKIGINEHMKANGYFTIVSNGKTFHYQDDHKAGWDVIRPRNIKQKDYHSYEGQEEGRRPLPYECLDLPESDYCDGYIAEQAVRDLRMLAKQDKPFFYGLGFYKPHLPFNVPKKYWDLYDRDALPIPDNYVLKEGNDIPAVALPNWRELRNYSGIPKKGPVPEDMARTLIHGYHAAVSFIDAQIGKVIAEMKSLGLDKNTFVVLIGDHGWNLGEHGCWCKHSILETSIHVPFIIVDPDAPQKGVRCDEVVEFLSIFPTICDAAGIPKPAQLEGESILPLVGNPKEKGKGWAVCRWLNGFTIVTNDNYFYTEWWDKDDNVTDRLLFDHNVDPEENYNVAEKPEYAKLVKKLSKALRQRRGPEFDKYGPEYNITHAFKPKD